VDGGHDRSIRGAVRKLAHVDAIDLYLGERQPTQAAQRRETGAEVVE
jgi:hypothetical protein